MSKNEIQNLNTLLDGDAEAILNFLLTSKNSSRNLVLLFPGNEIAGTRHDIRNSLAQFRVSGEVNIFNRAKRLVENLLGQESQQNLCFYEFIPKPVKREVYDLQNSASLIEWDVIDFNRQISQLFNSSVNKELSILLDRFVSNAVQNLTDVFDNRIKDDWKFRLNCNVFMIDKNHDGFDGFFIDNNGPLINDKIFKKLGKKSTSTHGSNRNQGIGLHELAKDARELGYSIVCAQWDEKKIMTKNLSEDIFNSSNISNPQDDQNTQLGLSIRKTSIETWKNSSVSNRKPPSMAFGIIGNKEIFRK